MRFVLSLFLALGLVACSANVSNYHEQGGKWTIGGEVEVKDASTFTSTANQFPKVKKVALAAAATSGGVLSWANPTSSTIIVERLVLDVTTAATGAATVDCGSGSTSTTIADTLIDGLDVNAATGVFDNVENQGTNGKSTAKLASGDYVTCTQKTGDVTGLVGSAYIHYFAQ